LRPPKGNRALRLTGRFAAPLRFRPKGPLGHFTNCQNVRRNAMEKNAKKAKYSICGDKVEFAGSYPNLVCRKCEVRAVNETREIPYYESAYNDGDNSVFYGIKRWRRYQFGGFITMKDDFDCETIFGGIAKTKFPAQFSFERRH